MRRSLVRDSRNGVYQDIDICWRGEVGTRDTHGTWNFDRSLGDAILLAQTLAQVNTGLALQRKGHNSR
jgi:hypothetical protein